MSIVGREALIASISEVVEARGPEGEGLLDRLTAAWSADRSSALHSLLPEQTAEAARALAEELSRITRTGGASGLSLELLQGARGAIVLAWAEAVAGRRDVALAPLLSLALRELQAPSRLLRAARARVRSGTLVDSLSCLPLSGDDGWLDGEDAPAIRSRIELLFWGAARSALSIPGAGAWLWQNEQRLERWLRIDLCTVRDRVIAASTLAVAADGFPDTSAADTAYTVHAVRTLAGHPEPEVWIPAARAMGRLAARVPAIKTLLFQWLHGRARAARRRAITALACLPGRDAWWLEAKVAEVLAGDDPWALAALGPAIPHLIVERREIWERLAARLDRDDCPPEVSWSAVQGLSCLVKREALDRPSEALLRSLRRRAIESEPRGSAEAQLLAEIRRSTDALDGIDPDPRDLELLLERAALAAIDLGAKNLAGRVTALVRAIGPTFDTALAELTTSPRAGLDRGEGLSVLESCARAAVFEPWAPVLMLAGRDLTSDTELEEVRERMRQGAASLISRGRSFSSRRSGLRVLGWLLESGALVARRGRAAGALHCLAALEQSSIGDRRGRARLDKTVGDLLWRVLDLIAHDRAGTEGAARLAAWWVAAGGTLDAEAVLIRAAPGLSSRRASGIIAAASALREALTREGTFADDAIAALETLGAADSALARGITGLALAVEQAAEARRVGVHAALAVALIGLAEACSDVAASIADPVRASSSSEAGSAWPDERYRELAPRTIDALGAAAPDPELLAAWSEPVGGVIGARVRRVLGQLFESAAQREGEVPPRRKIGPYRLEQRLGGGAQGEIWLARHERNDRNFVLKALPAKKIRSLSPEARSVLETSLDLEAQILKRIYHPNVASFVDSGWDGDQPYLVLEHLIGCDLEAYAAARPLSLRELQPIVADVCSGLRALASFDLVHGDLKPGNIFLRLSLPRGAAGFDPELHRAPEAAPLLTAVVIDFGLARGPADTDPDGSVRGSPGYLAPEQARGEVHPRTDVYSLGACIYRVLTGRPLFAELDSIGARILAHASRAPLDDPRNIERWPAQLPAELLALIREATALDPAARPDASQLALRFAAIALEEGRAPA